MSQSFVEHTTWKEIESRIFAIAGDIRFGSVEITIHDARVVQLEVTQKFRQPGEAQATHLPGRRTATR